MPEILGIVVGHSFGIESEASCSAFADLQRVVGSIDLDRTEAGGSSWS